MKRNEIVTKSIRKILHDTDDALNTGTNTKKH